GRMSNKVQELLEEIRRQGIEALKAAPTRKALYEAKVIFWGKSGKLTEVMKKMADLPKEEKPKLGQWVNKVKVDFEALYEERERELAEAEMDARMSAESMDLTLPAVPRRLGAEHPVSKVLTEMVGILSRIGYV